MTQFNTTSEVFAITTELSYLFLSLHIRENPVFSEKNNNIFVQGNNDLPQFKRQIITSTTLG